MLIAAFFAFLAYACFRGITRDFDIAGLMVVVGFTQDPARKLIEGEPVLMTIMVGVVMACAALRKMLLSHRSFAEPFSRWTDSISTPLTIYLLLILLQGVHSFLRYGSPIVTGLGAIFYIAPLIAIVVGYSQFQRFEMVRVFIAVFCVLALIAAVCVIASFIGVQSPVFGEVGSGLVIYDQGTVLKAYSGIMRSSEIASWHMGACVCFLIILLADRGSMFSLMFTVLAVTVLLGAIILTGRRKMILQILIFSGMYFPIVRYYQGRLSSRFLSIIVLGFILFSSIYLLLPSIQGTDYDLYVARSASVFNDAGARFSQLGLGSISWAYQAHGLLGGGLGVASQGAQHFVQVSSSGAGEGGLGKLVSELGVFSLFVVVWLSYVFAKHIHRCMQLVASTAPAKLALSVGILVFLVANVPTFIVASQVYGDVFVLLILGMLTGALFALPKQVVTRLTLQNAE